jgi:hypothetical protein
MSTAIPTVDQVLSLALQLPPEQQELLVARLAEKLNEPQPVTLAEQLVIARRQIVASGVPLLDWDALEQEIADRRGER